MAATPIHLEPFQRFSLKNRRHRRILQRWGQPVPAMINVDRAVILATSPQPGTWTGPVPFSLLPLGDRPLIQHLLELAVRCNLRHIDVIADDVSAVRRFVGNGQRWGVQITLWPATGNLIEQLRAMAKNTADANGGCVVMSCSRFAPGLTREHLVCHAHEMVTWHASGDCSGTLLMPWRKFAELSPEAASTDDIVRQLHQLCGRADTLRACGSVASIHDGASALSCQQQYLTGCFPELLSTAFETVPGVRVGLRSRIHPTARLLAPVLIGDDCEIGAGAVIGPNAVISSTCFVDRGARLHNTLVLPNTMMGDEVCLSNTIVSADSILEASTGNLVPVPEESLLSSAGHGGIVACIARFVDGVLIQLARLCRLG